MFYVLCFIKWERQLQVDIFYHASACEKKKRIDRMYPSLHCVFHGDKDKSVNTTKKGHLGLCGYHAA